MEYNKNEQGIRICLNKEELPFKDYYIGNDNYYRRIDDVNPKKGKSGYALMGNFEDKKSTILFDGVLYLAVCRENGQKTHNYLFTVEKGDFVLIDDNKRKTKAVEPMWDKIEQFIAQRKQPSLQQLFNAVDSLHPTLRTLETFSVALHSYAIGYEFDANYQLPKTNEEEIQRSIEEIKETKEALKFYREHKNK